VGEHAPGVAKMSEEFRWRALGGAEVLCMWLPSGYGNAAHLPEGPHAPEQALERLRGDLRRLHTRAGVLIWMNGVDHTRPQPHLPRLLEAMRALAPELDIIHAGLEQAVIEVRARVRQEALPVLDGELRTPAPNAPILPGVLSARSWQKVLHDRAQIL